MTRNGKVTVVGAGFYGSTTAQRLAEYDLFEEVVLTDIVQGKPEGLALDMNQSRPVEGFETVVTGQTTGPASEGYEAIRGSSIIIVTAGLPRQPGISRRRPKWRGRDRRPAQDRVRVLRPVGGRRPDGPGGGGGLRRGAAGLRVGGRRVRHLRGLPGCRSRDRRGRSARGRGTGPGRSGTGRAPGGGRVCPGQASRRSQPLTRARLRS